jgi:RNA polymerase sigma factor (sigma-70 family)
MTGTEELLADYVQNGSEQAFRELVTSYINFVFSTAVRVVGGDKGLAEDVSQTVFMDLARKASELPRKVKLGGWLHRHTCFVARKALRRERRRIAREKLAVQLNAIEDYTEENLGHLTPVLDEAINDLGAKDRHAILLRFFEQRDFRAVAVALGSTEDAARMRVTRALEKMGLLLRNRGVVLSIVGLGFVLSTKTVTAAPAGLATRISHLALAQAAKGWTAVAFLKQACLTRLNAGIASAAIVVALMILLIPARHSDAMIKGLETKKGGWAELEDSGPEEAAHQPDNAPAPVASPAHDPVVSPAPEVAVNAEKPVPLLLPAPTPITVVPTSKPAPEAAPAPTTPAPIPKGPGGGSAQASSSAQGNWSGGGPGFWNRRSPVAPVAVTQTAQNIPPPKIATNNPSTVVTLPVPGREWAPVQAPNDPRSGITRTVQRPGNNSPARSNKRDNSRQP